jgi:hypothetical protein
LRQKRALQCAAICQDGCGCVMPADGRVAITFSGMPAWQSLGEEDGCTAIVLTALNI